MRQGWKQVGNLYQHPEAGVVGQDPATGKYVVLGNSQSLADPMPEYRKLDEAMRIAEIEYYCERMDAESA